MAPRKYSSAVKLAVRKFPGRTIADPAVQAEAQRIFYGGKRSGKRSMRRAGRKLRRAGRRSMRRSGRRSMRRSGRRSMRRSGRRSMRRSGRRM